MCLPTESTIVIDWVDTATGAGYADYPVSKDAPPPQARIPRLFQRPRYRRRNVIERLFGWMKEKQRLCTRYDKLAKSYRAMVTLCPASSAVCGSTFQKNVTPWTAINLGHSRQAGQGDSSSE
ncbi:transposase [Halomonas eurihalina]|uniref:Transposase n=1 Tax=Halomonas eurihalina TaxID=42566 RepID=A0A5D9DBJ8_HALER|nr:transposase [Halomonas eurihalina]